MRYTNEIDRDAPLTATERALAGCGILSWLISIFAIGALMGGCATYRGGKVVDGTNIAIGITIPGTDWTINALDYIAGLRVAGNDATAIAVTNEVAETNSYFGVITTTRTTRMTASIAPTESAETTESVDE